MADPTSREAHAAAAELDAVLEENPALQALVEDMINPASLPPGWSVRFDESTGRREYTNEETGEVRYAHPLADYYKGASFMEAGGYQQLVDAESQHPPTSDEIMDMCTYLGMAPDEDGYVKEVARMAISAPLPPHWHEQEDENGNVIFVNEDTGMSQPAHPLDGYFVELINRRRNELMNHADGVGILSAMANKRLSKMGLPGMMVPEELKDEPEDPPIAEEPESPGPATPPITVKPAEEDEDSIPPNHAQQYISANGYGEEASAVASGSYGSYGLEDKEPADESVPEGPPAPGRKSKFAAMRGEQGFEGRHISADARRHTTAPEEDSYGGDAYAVEDDAPPKPPKKKLGGPKRGGRTAATPVLIEDLDEGGGGGATSSIPGYRTSDPGSGPPRASSASRIPRPPSGTPTGRGWHRLSSAGGEGGDGGARQRRRGTADDARYKEDQLFHVDGTFEDDGGVPRTTDLRRTKSFSEWETGRLLKALDQAAAGLGVGGAALLANLKNGLSAGFMAVKEEDTGPKAAERERIRVAVRAKPLKKGEIPAWVIDPGTKTVRMKENLPIKHSNADHVYSFDIVFNHDVTNKQLWSQHVAPMMEAALKGMNTTVFAYGQTSSGKTYTIFGSHDKPSEGTIGLSMTYLFQALQHQLRTRMGSEEYVVKLSMLELYNEQLRDLLNGPALDKLGRPVGNPTALAIQEDPVSGVRVAGLTEQPIEDMRSAMEFIAKGSKARQTGATCMNEQSSRSHTIVRVSLETRECITHDLKSAAIINFVDLAGSERLSKTGTTGQRFAEGTSINISLLMLGTVIAKLAEGSRGTGFIPFRNSKLTRLLQPCLGGNAKTAIVATLSQATEQIEETFNTLNFAARAMKVMNEVSINDKYNKFGKVGNKQNIKRKKGAKGDGKESAALRKQVEDLEGQLKDANKKIDDEEVVIKRINKLELDKAKLLHKLEEAYGTPLGDIYDDLPETPPGLDLPVGRPSPASAMMKGNVKPETALKSIARIAFMNKGASQGEPPARQDEEIPPEDVVQAVREMRAERDELRKRYGHMETQVAAAYDKAAGAASLQGLAGSVADAVIALEDIVGTSPLAAREDAGKRPPPDTPEEAAARLNDNIQAVSLMYREFDSVQRQLITAEALAEVAARRADAAEEALSRHAQAAAGEESSATDDQLRTLVKQLEDQLGFVRAESDAVKAELNKWRGLAEMPPEVADAALEAADRQDQGAAPDPALVSAAALPVGSYAIAQARAAQARVVDLEEDLHATRTERDELRARLDELGTAAAEGPPTLSARAVASSLSMKAPSVRFKDMPPLPPPTAMPAEMFDIAAAPSVDGTPRSTGNGPSAFLNASIGGPAGKAQFEKLKAHVATLTREVAALTKERDSLLNVVLKMQGNDGAAEAIGSIGPAQGLTAQNYSTTIDPEPSASTLGHAPTLRGRRAIGALGPWDTAANGDGPDTPASSNSGKTRLGMMSMKLADLDANGLPLSGLLVKTKSTRGGGGDGADSALFSPMSQASVASRATLANVPEPVLNGVRDAEIYALRKQLATFQKSAKEKLEQREQELKIAQAAAAVADRQTKEQGKAYAADLKRVMAEKEEEVAKVRAEDSKTIKGLKDEIARLRAQLASSSGDDRRSSFTSVYGGSGLVPTSPKGSVFGSGHLSVTTGRGRPSSPGGMSILTAGGGNSPMASRMSPMRLSGLRTTSGFSNATGNASSSSLLSVPPQSPSFGLPLLAYNGGAATPQPTLPSKAAPAPPTQPPHTSHSIFRMFGR